MRYLFQVSSLSEAVNSIYEQVVLHRTVDMSVLPREMRRSLYKARLQQGEDDNSVNLQLFLRLVVARLLRRESEALKFSVQVCPFAINEFYTQVYMLCTNW